MNISWNIRPLREHIKLRATDSTDLSRVLDSIDRYVDIFLYHLILARDAMKDVIVQDDPIGLENLKFVFGSSKKQSEYAQAKIASEANILGCIHATRSLLDVFAFFVNGLVLASRIPINTCDIRAVTAELSDSPLKERLGELLRSYWFGYVSAFVNTAKHRQLVQHGFWVSFESGVAGIRLEGFEYNKVKYPQCDADDLLRGIVEVQNSVVDCGKRLNDLVLGSAATDECVQ